MIVLISCYCLEFSNAELLQEEMECQIDGTCQETTTINDNDIHECGLYLAESSIPNAGWGLYTGKDISKGTVLDVMDVVIQYADYREQYKKQLEYTFRNDNNTFPETLLSNYWWDGAETFATFDATRVDTLVPGLGMLPNCHLGLSNLDQIGCNDRKSTSRQHPTVGASSEYHDCGFYATKDIPKYHELFDDYGIEYFESRRNVFGDDFPLVEDYEIVQNLVRKWQKLARGKNIKFAINLYDNLINVYKPNLSQRTLRAMPNSTTITTLVDYNSTIRVDNKVVYQDVPNAIRTKEWLQTNGICIDNNIIGKPITYRNNNTEYGAFAKRHFKLGDIVASTPLVHTSRHHLEYLWTDDNNKPKSILWKGYQLIINYCFGHTSTSLLFFPSAPIVNLINHGDGKEQKPNVAIRWSTNNKMMHHNEWLELNTTQLLAIDKSGLILEYYAIQDIQPDDEILLDYGDIWQKAWDNHIENWNIRYNNDDDASSSTPIVHANDYISAYDYEIQCNENISKNNNYNCFYTIPSWIELRCWIITEKDKMKKAGEWYLWLSPELDDNDDSFVDNNSYYGLIDETKHCKVVNVDSNSGLFYVQIKDDNHQDNNNYYYVMNVPRSAITFVNLPYTSNQYIRDSFRHEIQLPDNMIPNTWKDLQPPPNDDDSDSNSNTSCGLYMAESAIPNSGLGMYSAKHIPIGERIFYGDVVIQVEDMDINTRLRHWANYNYNNQINNEKPWLLHNYYWNPDISIAIYDAMDVQSIIPGLGMLANSHTGLMNAEERAPNRISNLHRYIDPGTGASTTYHDVHFRARKNITIGEELLVQYGDEWFADRESLGEIPLSDDFQVADWAVGRVESLLRNSRSRRKSNDDTDQKMAVELLQLTADATSARPRLSNAFPVDEDSYNVALKEGTASLTMPDRIRSIEWLEQNGRCLDNIRPDVSTVRQAGRGAFATRRIKKGDIVAPMPLVHIRRRHMEIFDTEDMNNPHSTIRKVGSQLLLNYCYGHKDSSLLFFPYSPVVNYVNHNHTDYNAELRWSSLPNHRDDWLLRTPDDLDAEDHAGLIMELVATRDIEPNEEVFLNYGTSWEESWKDYVDNWRPDPDTGEHYVSTAELNRRYEWLKTVAEEEVDPYLFSNRDDVFTVCFTDNVDKVHMKGSHEEIPTIPWSGSKYLFDSADFAHPCEIVGRSHNHISIEHSFDRKDSVKPVDLRYNVIIELDRGRKVRVQDVPRKAIQFFDNEYSSDNFLRSAFRHEIHLPDDMVPETWKDLL